MRPAPTAAQVYLALDIIDFCQRPGKGGSGIEQDSWDLVAAATKEPGWTGATENCKAYGQPPDIDEALAAKVRAFDKIAQILFLEHHPTDGPRFNRRKFLLDTVDVSTMGEVMDTVAAAIPELLP